MAAQRAAGDAFCGTVKPQLRPSALRPDLPAANAALEAVMQTRSRPAAAISISSRISSLMGISSTLLAELAPNLALNPRLSVLIRVPKPAHSLHKFTPVQCAATPAMVSVRKHDA